MTMDLAVVLVLLSAAIVMFVIGRPRMDAVALIMIAALPLTGIITMNEALAGFSDSSVVLIGLLFVIGDGLVRTGVARRFGDWLSRSAGGNETRLVVLLMLAAGGLGALMSSTAVVAIFIPVVLRICGGSGIQPGRLMMPLSVAALISGMLTLVATAPNLVVNAELIRHGLAGFGFFAVTPFGVPVLLLGIVYMVFARRLLPAGKSGGSEALGPRRGMQDWIAQYGLAERVLCCRIKPGSEVAGMRLKDIKARALGVTLLAIERSSRAVTETIRPGPHTELLAGDVLYLDVVQYDDRQKALRDRFDLEVLPAGGELGYLTDLSHEVGMVEVMLSPESKLIGQTVLHARVRSDSGLTVVGLRRGQTVLSDNLLEATLRLGDTLLLIGFWSDIKRLQNEGGDFVVLAMPPELADALPAASRSVFAVGVLALVVGLMVSGVVANVHAALIGCLLMGLFGCVDLTSAYRSISWKSLILIVGMMPFSIALQRTGGVDLAADALVRLVGDAGPRFVIGVLFLVTALLGLFISNTATAVLMAPVALAIAAELHANPYPFAMIVALASSAAFMTPISSPVNTLVLGPGNYAFGDFVKIGVPFTIIVMMVFVVLVPWLLPLY